MCHSLSPLRNEYSVASNLPKRAGSIMPDTISSPSLGTEKPGIASFNFDEFVVTTANGNVRIKTPAEGGEVDAKYLNGKEETYYTNPENLTRNVPIERGGTNLNSFTAGDILYAATDIGDGTFSQSSTAFSYHDNSSSYNH